MPPAVRRAVAPRVAREDAPIVKVVAAVVARAGALREGRRIQDGYI